MMYKFFSIGHFQNFIKYAKLKYPEVQQFELVSSLKIHGTHIDLVKCFGPEKKDPEDSVNSEEMSALQIQSRNNILGADSDMYGVYSFLTLRKTVIDAFFERIVAFRKPKEKVIIACEFAGSNIQRNIALNKTSKFLVIYGVKVDSEWLAQDDWATLMLESQADRIYNVRDERLPSYKIVLDINDVTSTQNQLATVVDEIDRNCPFGANIFGVQGAGEGLVLHAKGFESDTDMYFKVKGASHCETKVKTLRPISEEMIERTKTVSGFVDAVLTPRRFEQGYEYLLEQNLDSKNIKNINNYIKWVVGDIVKECSDDLEELGLGDTQNKKLVTKEISNRAQAHYKTNM